MCRDAEVYEESFKKYEWKRISELKMKGKLQIFDESIAPSDIAQGGLGNCYFLSVLSALAEKPERIKKLFIDKEINDKGIYGVWLTKNGVK